MGFFALSTLVVAGAGVYLLSKVFPNFQVGNKKIQQDLKEMRQELEDLTHDLIKLAPKDMELLSDQPIDKTHKKGFTQNYTGRLQTIFHEPVAAYYYRKYNSRKEDALLYVQMETNSFYYWISKGETRLTINNYFIGVIDEESKLYGGNKKRLIARLNKRPRDYWSLIVADKEVAGLSLGHDRQTDNKDLTGRAFEFIANDLNDDEKALLLAFTFFEIIKRVIK